MSLSQAAAANGYTLAADEGWASKPASDEPRKICLVTMSALKNPMRNPRGFIDTNTIDKRNLCVLMCEVLDGILEARNNVLRQKAKKTLSATFNFLCVQEPHGVLICAPRERHHYHVLVECSILVDFFGAFKTEMFGRKYCVDVRVDTLEDDHTKSRILSYLLVPTKKKYLLDKAPYCSRNMEIHSQILEKRRKTYAGLESKAAMAEDMFEVLCQLPAVNSDSEMKDWVDANLATQIKRKSCYNGELIGLRKLSLFLSRNAGKKLCETVNDLIYRRDRIRSF